MKVLGIRNSSKFFRYCILEEKDGKLTLLNKDTESKTNIPNSLKGDEVYIWYKREIERLLDYGPFDRLAIKRNENIPSCYSKLKGTMFFDCIATIVALENNIKTKSYIYNQMHTNAKAVLGVAEQLVGETKKYWNNGIADAIVAANCFLTD